MFPIQAGSSTGCGRNDGIKLTASAFSWSAASFSSCCPMAWRAFSRANSSIRFLFHLHRRASRHRLVALAIGRARSPFLTQQTTGLPPRRETFFAQISQTRQLLGDPVEGFPDGFFGQHDQANQEGTQRNDHGAQLGHCRIMSPPTNRPTTPPTG